ncbi:MAG: Flp pilus assembly complex ATPase component TadA [Lactobacillales bacterium]|jgi:twitching motility protein PilT|nr:Flp pilus assembly complex ATPase component TadA [Lactobacillales bacterium]
MFFNKSKNDQPAPNKEETPLPPHAPAIPKGIMPQVPATVKAAEEIKETPQEIPVETPKESLKEEKQPTAMDNIQSRDGGSVVRVSSVSSIKFADIWVAPENVSYIRDPRTAFALIPIEADDLDDFRKTLEQGYTGSSSYALRYKEESYRVERITTTTGVQYNCRKMPKTTPDVYTLGLPKTTVDYLVGLSRESGLILVSGPTGMGKTTTISSLLRKYLEKDGGFLYTVEDPPEMPLDGLYKAANGGLGLAKQTAVENERWEDGLKSALRSRPRYILVGEIRTPETASQMLRAATSGHLVLSTIHANSVEDSLNSVIKYATGAGLPEDLVSDLLARSVLAVINQKLEGTKNLRPVIYSAFANPNPLMADQMRATIREGKIQLGTLMEAQATKLLQGRPLFKTEY